MREEGNVQSAMKSLQLESLFFTLREKKTYFIMRNTQKILMFSLFFMISLAFIYLSGLYLSSKLEVSRHFHASVISAFFFVVITNAYCLSSYRREQMARSLNQQKKIAAILKTFDECNEEVTDCVKQNIQNPTYANSYPVQVALSVHLQTLGLPEETRDMKVIRKRYKELVKKCHPDSKVAPNALEMTAINVAYQKIKTFL